jgi:serine/threonine-protein kinase
MLTAHTPFDGPNPIAVMNDRLVNDPTPPREINPEISVQMQEIIYRALERDPENRYAGARKFALDLEHPDTVEVTDRSVKQGAKQEPVTIVKRILSYAMLAIIPVAIFKLLLFVANLK